MISEFSLVVLYTPIGARLPAKRSCTYIGCLHNIMYLLRIMFGIVLICQVEVGLRVPKSGRTKSGHVPQTDATSHYFAILFH